MRLRRRQRAGDVAVSSAYPYRPAFVAGTGGLRFPGSRRKSCAIDGASGAISASADPPELNSPAKGAAIPQKDSHGEPERSAPSDRSASPAEIGSRRLPPRGYPAAGAATQDGLGAEGVVDRRRGGRGLGAALLEHGLERAEGVAVQARGTSGRITSSASAELFAGR